ncbi:hypothetical protein AXF42_Ash014856 [Apostasia shenzhenica]|uniref:DUF4378 domain-containing protein n=1 Tax=Apostasia shenzhenica TaxID=1088818 RepID=A0A2I0ALA8_9ASPA|nr:hypothetical protein AXF42_Ash014856 [Apostasia shenzhenica]
MHSSRSRERFSGATDPRLDLRSGLHEEGNVYSNSWNKVLRTGYDSNCDCRSPLGTNSITIELKSSSKKAGGTSVKALIDEEMSREKHIKRSSPNLIARLMGLDSLPSSGGFKLHREPEVRNHPRRLLSNGLHEKFTYPEDFALQTCNDEQNCKDVYEVVETTKVEKQKKQVGHELEALNSYNDIYHHFLVESQSLLPKHFKDGSCSPLESILSTSLESSIRSERNVDRYVNQKGVDSQFFQKPTANHCCHRSREHIYSLLQKLSQSAYSRKDDGCVQPTQIVILKPSLDKVRKKERILPRVKNMNHSEVSSDEVLDLFAEERALRKLHSTFESSGNRMKGSKETTKVVRKELKKNNSTERRKISSLELNEHAENEDSWTMSSINQRNSRTSNRTSANFCEYPLESLVSWEARKRLSDRWNLTSRSQEMGALSRVSGTLGEMLALSDNETPKMMLDTSSAMKANKRKLVREDWLEMWYSPLGISSKDGWKDEFSRNLPRSKSLSASSLVYNSQHSSKGRRNCPNRYMLKNTCDRSNKNLSVGPIQQKNTLLTNHKYHCNIGKRQCEEENYAVEREIHVSSEQLKINNEQQAGFELSDDSIAQRSEVADNFTVLQFKLDNNSSTCGDKQLEKLQEYVGSENLSGHDPHEILSKEMLFEHGGETRFLSQSTFAKSHNEADQPSPVSVLEPTSEEEKSTSGCFEKISADLEELRMQLRLLKMESLNGFTEEMEAHVSSDEDAGETVQVFRDEEERDYSYLLDIFIHSGFLNCDLDELPNSSDSAGNLIGMQAFNRLEKKYQCIDSTWLRSDRKLLFDLTSSILIDIKKRNVWQPKMVDEGLVEEAWLRVVKQRKEIGRIPEEDLTGRKWFDVGDDRELVERELVILLLEDLMNELVI